MTGDESKFIYLEKRKGRRVTFGDSKTLNVIGKGKIGNKKFTIDKVHLVKGLKYNLISVSQLLDKGHSVVYSKDVCTISHVANKVPLIARRDGNIFILDFKQDSKAACCLATLPDEAYLWHRRLGHVH